MGTVEKTKEQIYAELTKDFDKNDLEWRVGMGGVKEGKPWAKILAYTTLRGVQTRLDTVVGFENWKNEYQSGPNGGIMCGLSIRINGEWLTKWDGSDNKGSSDDDSIKGGFSGSMKRAAVQWGMGRHLYYIGDTWAVFNDNGQHTMKEGGRFYKWDPPKECVTAIPGKPPVTQQNPPETNQKPETKKPPVAQQKPPDAVNQQVTAKPPDRDPSEKDSSINQQKAIYAIGTSERKWDVDTMRAVISKFIGRPITKTKELSMNEAREVINMMKDGEKATELLNSLANPESNYPYENNTDYEDSLPF